MRSVELNEPADGIVRLNLMDQCANVFVYGTLRKAARPDIHARFLGGQSKWLGEGAVAGRLFLVSWFPALVRADKADDQVLGEVFRLTDFEKTILPLDEFEGCDLEKPQTSEYTRGIVPVRMRDGSTMPAWCYFYLRSVDGLERIASGDFVDELNLRKDLK